MVSLAGLPVMVPWLCFCSYLRHKSLQQRRRILFLPDAVKWEPELPINHREHINAPGGSAKVWIRLSSNTGPAPRNHQPCRSNVLHESSDIGKQDLRPANCETSGHEVATSSLSSLAASASEAECLRARIDPLLNHCRADRSSRTRNEHLHFKNSPS